MAFSFAKVKSLVRRTVHKTFGVQAFYQDSTLISPVTVTARLHINIDRFGDLENQSYGELIQAIDKVIFEASEVRKIPVKRGGTVIFPDFSAGLGVALGSSLDSSGIGPTAFVLNIKEPVDGPFREVWTVTRKEAK